MKNIRSRLTLITTTIILSFISITTGLFAIFFRYFNHMIERVYGIDDDILAPFYSIIFIALVVLIMLAFVMSIIGGSFVSEHFLKNVRQFTEKIKQIKDDDIEKRLPITNNDELNELGKEFNLLMDDIEGSMEKQNQFVLDASHELKTPLAIINGNLDMLTRWGSEDPKVLSNALDVCKIETTRMITLTNELLQLTRAFDDTQEIQGLQIDIEIDRIVQEYEKLHPDFDIKFLHVDGSEVYIKSEHFNQMLVILLDNAIKYTRIDNKCIEIKYHNNILEVKDYGIGIEEGDIEKIFDRFYRVDESRKNIENSFGLGLSILKRLSEWYQFKITVESQKDKYTKFIITFKGEERRIKT